MPHPPAQPSPATPPPSEPRSLAAGWRLALSSWFMSGALHCVLMLVLVAILALRDETPEGAAEEPSRSAGIVLRSTAPEGERYDTEDSLAVDRAAAASNSNHFSAVPSTSANASVDSFLPPAPTGIGPTALGAEGIPDAGNFSKGISGPPIGKTGGKGARVKVFGVEGQGHKFVYVFDRSASMDEDNRIGFARRELIASLESLDSNHQFQIIFYNQEPRLFRPSGRRGQLSLGTEQNKTAAAKFVQSITPDGATNHEKALEMAVNLRPDVIFFLTDASDGLTGGQLQRIRRLNGGRASINAIQFDQGAFDGSANFSVRLAQQNGGVFRYVDVSKLGRGRR